MSDSPVWLFGVLLLLGLAGYALHLWRQVWSRQRAHRQTALDSQRRIGDSLRLLANSLLDDQVPLIEGAIRIKVLLDNYASELSRERNCEVFYLLYEATAGIPTHAAWKALDEERRRQHEKCFEVLELQHKDAARTAARWLLDQGLEQHRKLA
jgi:hypothetical protein